MKLFVCIALVAIVAQLFLTACPNNPTATTVSPADSLRIIGNFRKQTDTTPSNRIIKPMFYDFTAAAAGPDPITEPTAVAMIDSYAKYHDLGLINEDGDRIKGFVIKSADFKEIVKQAAKYSSVALYFGVKNHTETTPGKGEYTMIIVPIDKNSRAIRTGAIDYVLPCPKYCPTNGF